MADGIQACTLYGGVIRRTLYDGVMQPTLNPALRRIVEYGLTLHTYLIEIYGLAQQVAVARACCAGHAFDFTAWQHAASLVYSRLDALTVLFTSVPLAATAMGRYIQTMLPFEQVKGLWQQLSSTLITLVNDCLLKLNMADASAANSLCAYLQTPQPQTLANGYFLQVNISPDDRSSPQRWLPAVLAYSQRLLGQQAVCVVGRGSVAYGTNTEWSDVEVGLLLAEGCLVRYGYGLHLVALDQLQYPD
ncbi:MAG: hypothetical protein Tsb005_20880 [Gammaproteobacteria bacterium]